MLNPVEGPCSVEEDEETVSVCSRRPEVVLKDSKPVQLIHHKCSCIAGAALCNHCVALLYQSAHYSQLKVPVVPPVLSCPEGEQQLHKPRTLGIKPGPVDKMAVLSAKPKSRPKATTQGIRSTLYKGLRGDLPDLSVLRVTETYADFSRAESLMVCSMNISCEVPLVNSALGMVQAGSPIAYQQPAAAHRDLSFHVASPRPSLPWQGYHLQPSIYMSNTTEAERRHLQSLQVTWDMANKLESATRSQSSCEEWHQLRRPRLTASRFREICFVSNKCEDSLADRILKGTCQTKAMRRGLELEADAIWEYTQIKRRFWQTVRRLRRGKQYPTNTVYSGGGPLLTSTGDVVGRWEEYFEDLLNPAVTSSIKEAEAEGSEVDSSITQAEVTEVVKKLLGSKALGVDEIRPEYLKSLDVVGLSWLTRLCSITWRSGTVPLGWQTGVVVPLFKKGDRRVCSNYRGITLLSLPGKVYARVLERRIRPIVEPRIQEEQCGFRPGRGTLDQLYTLSRMLEGSWEFAQPVHMCFVDLEKAFDCVPCGGLWRVLREYGVRGPLLRAVRSLYDQSRSLVRIAGNQDLQHALGRFAAECEAAGMRISISKSEAMVLSWKRVACPLQVGGEFLPQVEEFKNLGVLFTSEGRMEWEIDRRIGAASAVMRSMYRSVVVKKELSRKAKLSIYQSIYVPTLTYGHELWVMTERIRSRIQAAEMSFLRRVAGRSLRDRVRSSVTWEELRVEPLLLHIERGQLRWLGHLFRMPPGRLPGKVFPARPTGRSLPAGLGTPRCAPGRARGSV
ncbi:unnamed protein product [Leuciscus chuanchicus]